ncbi:hypothetical protein [Streptomyces malaysiensis]|uniref:Uncharacterized protein n=1 Tax=Streptomyces malaysiensis subsp. samsunensis TaxID=459658 RepID=A0A9X2MAX7_STRMQ|nr:hypothetical protein [Streptomyces samsunensis]MCQ8836434.1 hypothetical protein [Streptomyces samsunensis]
MAKKRRGVRIPWVKDALGNEYDRSEIDRQPHPRYVTPLKCGGCGTRVSARHGNADDPDGRTSHYFKLDPHTPTCTYDLDQRGKQLVGDSEGTVVRRAGQWRLICPPLDQFGTGGHAKRPPAGTVRPGRSGGSGPRATSKQAGQAIASARRIVQILQDFDQDPEVAEEFAAVAPNGQRNIPWTEFCRGRADADQLAQALLDGAVDTIPHAVWGPVSTADAVGRDRDSYVVMYVARNPVHIEDRPVRLRVAVRCDRPDWIGATTRSGNVLAYGYWKLFPNDLSRAQSQGWIELQLWVKQPWQVARWDTDGTTVDLPKPVVRPRQPKPAPGGGAASPTPPPIRDVPPAAAPEPGSPAMLPPAALPLSPPQEHQEPVQSAPEPPAVPTEGSRLPAEPPRPSQPPLPPLPPFPPPEPGEGGRRSALGRWLRSVRRRRN